MSLVLHNTSECPPDYFRYLVPETGKRFPDPTTEPGHHYFSLRSLLDALARHYTANGLAVPADLSRLVQDQLCRLIPPDRCHHDTPGENKEVRRHHLTFDQVITGTKTVIGWQLQGRPKVDQVTLDTRAATCVRCPFNVLPSGCATCNSPLNAMVNAFVGSKKSQYDNAVHSCAICGCSLKALLQMPLEIVQENMPSEQREELPDYCWKK